MAANNDTNAPKFIQDATNIAIKDLKANNIEHDFGENALQYFEDYIEFDRAFLTEQAKKNLLAMCGAYLGESICRTYGHKWTGSDSGGWAVQIAGSTAEINVFGKVAKWLASGATGDSFVGFYRSIPELTNIMKHPKEDDESEN